jgi:hypothetical protein
MRVWAANVICAKDRGPRRWARRTGASILILALAAAAGTGCSAPSSGPPQAESPVRVDSDSAETYTPRAEPSVLVDPDRAETDPPRAESSALVDPDRDGVDEPRAESSVRVISDRHEIDYPRAIVLRLEIEADEEIAEVTLFYHLAGKPSRVYGYPQVMVGRSVSTEFSIRTGGAQYLPAGVEIEYYYRIQDSRGGVLETPHSRVTYLDPAYRWRELRQGDLVVTWHDLSEERVRKVVTDAEARLRVAKEMFGLDDVRPIKAVIFNSRKESDRGLPFVSEAASQRHLYGGFAFQAYDQFVLSGLSEHGITHEATHLLLGQAVSSPLAKIPAWLNEGLATYFEASDFGRARTVAGAARGRRLLRLRSMGAVPGRPEDVVVFYAQAWSVVTHMIETHGAERMGALLDALDSGLEIDEALRSVYGMGVDGLEAEWRALLEGSISPWPRPDPGTVGTSALLTGAAAVAAVVSAYRWLVREPAEPEEPEDPEGSDFG